MPITGLPNRTLHPIPRRAMIHLSYPSTRASVEVG